MSFEKDPTRGYGDDASARKNGIATRFASVMATLEAVPERVGTHLSEWPSRYVEMRTEAVSGER